MCLWQSFWIVLSNEESCHWPSTSCSFSLTWLSGTFFCCSGFSVPREKTTSISTLSWSWKTHQGTLLLHSLQLKTCFIRNKALTFVCTRSVSSSMISENGSQARYVSVVFHHKGMPTTITTAAMARAAYRPRCFSAPRNIKDRLTIDYNFI